MKKLTIIFFFFFGSIEMVSAQISSFPYQENFDLVSPPSLPIGWTTTTNKSISGDFTTSTTTTAPSAPNTLSATDATKSQSVTTAYFNFKGKLVDSLEFYERRTSTHTSGLLIEAAIGSDTTFPILITDTLKFVNGTSYVRHSVPLSVLLNDKDSVRFRFRIVGNGSGATGVLRIDNITLTTKKTTDLALTSLSFFPVSPKYGEQITATARVTNRAISGYFSGTVQLYDSLSLVSSQSFSQMFGLNESLAVSLQYPNIKAGRHPITTKLIVNGDEDTTNNSSSTVINVGFRSRAFLINEIMYAPLNGMPEWVEIINNSTDTIPISSWKISDATSNRALISQMNQMIAPNSYFVITTDTTAIKNFYPISAPLFQAPFSALNNTGDAVIIFDQTGFVIDSVAFSSSWGGSSGGRSLERVDNVGSSTLQTNWKTSTHPLGATPGAVNSVTQKSFDASVIRISIIPQFPFVGNTMSVSGTIKNIGKQSLSSLNVQLFIDTNKDSVLSASEIQFQQNILQLNANDSITIQSAIPSLVQGTHWLFVKISTLQDDDTSNNVLFNSVTVGIPPKSIIVNEIMYAPTGDIPEWIELYNTTNAAISLSLWKISDNGTIKVSISNPSASIASHSYCIVATDSSLVHFFPIAVPVFVVPFSALNNTTPDAVVLYDDRGAIIDSVYYRQSWGGLNGSSLQRFDYFSSSTDSANWKSTLPSPGNENPSSRKDIDVEIKNISAIKISNGLQIQSSIVNSGRQTAQALSIKFYHDSNRDSIAQQTELIESSVVSTLNPSDSATVLFNWNFHVQGKQIIIGTVETTNDMRLENNSRSIVAKNNFLAQTLVINEILYEPSSGKSEFVELYNRSTDTIDVVDWKLMDQPSTSGSRAIISLSKNSLLIPPNGFVVVASDSSFFTQFPFAATKNISINSSLSLNNSGEDLVLTDLTDTQIDSVHYSPSWHLKNISFQGRSLERINPLIQSNDVRNWSSSVAAGGSSPAEKNSIFIGSIASSSSLTLSPNPFSPDNDGFEDFLSISFSLPVNSTTIRVRIFDVNGRLIRRLVQSEPSPSTSSIIWNGLDDDDNRVRIGMYIILFEALDNFGGTVKTMKDVAVVGRKL